MGLLAYLITLVFVGLIVGALARLALPGRDPMSIPMTIGIGVLGSFIAGLLVRLITGGRAGAGILLSVLVSTGLVYLVRRSRERSVGGPPGDRGPGGGLWGRGRGFRRPALLGVLQLSQPSRSHR